MDYLFSSVKGIRQVLYNVIVVVAAMFIGGQSLGAVVVDSVSVDLKQVESVDTTDVVTKDLEEYTVTANLYERKGSRESFVFNKEDFKKSRNVGELLGRLPMLRYSAVSESIDYMGSKRIKYMIDSIPRETEEVIGLLRTNPNKFYKADVVVKPTGIYLDYDLLINLHSRRDYQGLDFTFGDRTEIIPTNYYGKGKHFKMQNEFATVSYIMNKFDLHAQVSSYWGRNANSFSAIREFPLMDIAREWKSVARDEPNSTGLARNVAGILRLGYSLNENHRISLYAKDVLQGSESYSRESFIQRKLNIPDYSDASVMKLLADSRNRRPLDGNLVLNYRGQVRSWVLYAQIEEAYGINSSESKYQYIPGDLIKNDYRNNSNVLSLHFEASRMLYGDRMYMSFTGGYVEESVKVRDNIKEEVISKGVVRRSALNANLDYFPNDVFSMGITAGSIWGSSSNYDYSHSYINPLLILRANWSPSRKLFVMASYFLAPMDPSPEELVERLVNDGDILKSSGNPQLKTSLAQNLNLSMRLWNGLGFAIEYFNIKNNVFRAVRQVQSNESLTGRPYVLIFPDNEHYESLEFKLMYGKTFFNHFEVSANVFVMYNYARYKELTNRKWLGCGSIRLGYIGWNNTFRAQLSYNYGDLSNITTLSTNINRSDLMSLYVSKRLLKSGNLNVFLNYTLPIHFGDNKNRTIMNSDVYRYQINSDNYYRNDNLIRFGFDYYFHKGDRIKQFDERTFEF